MSLRGWKKSMRPLRRLSTGKSRALETWGISFEQEMCQKLVEHGVVGFEMQWVNSDPRDLRLSLRALRRADLPSEAELPMWAREG